MTTAMSTTRGKSAKYFYAGLVTSISSLLQHGTEWPIVVILDGDGIEPEMTQVLKALGVAEVIHAGKELMQRHPRYGEVINQANENAPEHYFGYGAKVGCAPILPHINPHHINPLGLHHAGASTRYGRGHSLITKKWSAWIWMLCFGATQTMPCTTQSSAP